MEDIEKKPKLSETVIQMEKDLEEIGIDVRQFYSITFDSGIHLQTRYNSNLVKILKSLNVIGEVDNGGFINFIYKGYEIILA